MFFKHLTTPLDDYHAHLEFALTMYLRRPGVDQQTACLQGIDFFVNILRKGQPKEIPEERTGNVLGKSSIGTTGSMALFSEQNEMINDSIEAPSLTKSTKKIKDTSINRLMQFKAETKKQFEELQVELADCIPAKTNVLQEIEVLRAHLFSASMACRYSSQKRQNAATNESLAALVIDSIDFKPKAASTEELKCLETLRKTSKLSFVMNQFTYYDDKYCGTPDAVVLVGGAVTEVAEFKTESQVSAATSQLQVYLRLFKLRRGYLALIGPKGARVEIVEMNDIANSTLDTRYDRYKELDVATN
jgi:hypothetical protein